jgi:DNA-binding transcriptional LysR family regulator
MNELACIKAFVKTVECGSQLKAATELNLTSPAINKQIAKLEEKLGETLLERDTKASKLTLAGNQYYAIYVEVLSKLDEISTIKERNRKKPRGRLLISVSHTIAKEFIFPYVGQFNSLYPDISLVFNIQDPHSSNLPAKNHIVISDNMIFSEAIHNTPMFETSDILCASPSYLKSKGHPKKLTDLYQHHYIEQCQRVSQKEISLSKKNTIELNKPFIRVDDEQSAIDLALQDLGYIFVKEFQVRTFLREKVLIQLLPQFTKNKSVFSMYYQNQKYLPAKITVFLEFFRRNS